ncbi:AraC family transcriptional regulator [Pseudodesulfovibrio tunisiensis]|uniref:AraC family transcriptional regulator n=1 Tax=Pseudodesulfovibrio tunisiensis TaxID=463192 RepID=UPI001FB3F16D|nr:AraC family transcriptional regulator [Pseudodesulfovibrio tunisiensis]
MKTSTRNTYHERMLKVLLHIQANLDDRLGLESLAEVACFSPTHFHRIFRGMIGETVMEHIRRIRLERAALRLAMRMGSVTSAALDAGYETVESFSRAFNRMFGCPPSRYAEQHWEKLYSRVPGLIHYLPGDVRPDMTLNNSGGSGMEVRIEEIPAFDVAFVRHIGPYEECEKAWNVLCGWAGPKGLLTPDTKVLGICYDDPQVTPPEKIRYDACMTIHGDVQTEGEIGTQTIPAGEYAITVHKGPYSELHATYAKLFGQWLVKNDLSFADTPCYELYLNDPQQTAPDDLVTEIYLPLKRD